MKRFAEIFYESGDNTEYDESRKETRTNKTHIAVPHSISDCRNLQSADKIGQYVVGFSDVFRKFSNLCRNAAVLDSFRAARLLPTKTRSYILSSAILMLFS